MDDQMHEPPFLAPDLKAEVEGFLAEQIAAAGRPAPVPSVIIGGPTRVGKTTAATTLARAMGMRRISADLIKREFCPGRSPAERRWIMTYTLRSLLRRMPEGLVLEGSAFTRIARGVARWARAKRRRTPVFVLGCTGDPAEKAAGILHHRDRGSCWTQGTLSAAEVGELAEQIVKASRRDRAFCARLPARFFDITATRFERDIEAAVEEMTRALGRSG